MLDIPRELAPISETLALSLRRVEHAFAAAVDSESAPVQALLTHVERYRGKMLRPSLVVLSSLACAPDTDVPEGAITAAAVVEMVHMATLVHDDVLDEADLRRDGPTINHLRGNEAAVMLGDYLLASAYALCSSIPQREAAVIVARASVTTCAGELLQLHHRADEGLDEATYLDIIAKKTGDLIGASAEVGAIVADAPIARRTALRRFGVHLGMAFQIRDDLLDLLSSDADLGKPAGRDAALGKATLPLIHHLRAADPATRSKTLSAARGGDRTALRNALEATGSLAYARETATDLVRRAKHGLAPVTASPARDFLLVAADAVLTRNR
ncbi:MAG TPA: polyprenyl synthetase family protein [Phycisphaerales bacterium]|nr:polyprenyl synthetase family protein [Phycisphaerales bacterium]